MNQSVYNYDYRDPKQIAQICLKTKDKKLESHLEQTNSIYNLKSAQKSSSVKKCETEIDFHSLRRKQEKCKNVEKKKSLCSYSSALIMNRCQNNDDKRLYKTTSTSCGRFGRSPGEMTTTAASKICRDVTRNDFFCRLHLNNVLFIVQTSGQAKGLCCERRWMFWSANVQVSFHWSNRSPRCAFAKVKPCFEKL